MILRNDKPGNYNFVLILGLAGFISAADNWFVSPVLPAIAAGFGTSVSQAGAILTAYMIPYGFMQPIYGFFSDRKSKAKTLRFIVFGLSLGTAGCVLATSLWMLCIFRFITGFFAAGIIAVSLAFIGDMIPNDLRQIYVGRFMGIVFLGQGISTSLGGFFAKYISWRTAFLFFCIVAFIIALLLRKLPNNASVVNTKQKNLITELKFVIKNEKGRIIFPLALVTGFLLIGLYSYLGSYLYEVSGLNYLQVGAIMMFYGLSCLAAGSIAGKTSRRLGQPGTILTGGCFALLTASLLAYFHLWQIGLIATISLGFGYIFIQSTLATIAFDISKENTGLSSGLVGLGLFSGGGIGTAVNGFLLNYFTYKNLWQILAAGILLFILILIKLCLMERKKSILSDE